MLAQSARHALAFVYNEGRSSQWNLFEADTTAALAVGDAVHHEVQPPVLLRDLLVDGFDLGIVANVALEQQRVLQRRRQLGEVFAEALVLVGKD